jgi:chromate transporter
LVHLSGFASAAALIHGLKLFAVAVVADAVLSMARNFCQTNRAKSLALLACGLTLLQWPAYAVIAIAAVMIVVISRAFPVNRQDRTEPQPAEKPVIQPQADNVWRQSAGWLLLWGLLLLMALAGSGLLWAGFYRSGSLVFGGGHVVLPLLQQTFATQLAADSLLTGYAAAQVMPGPMFTLATYLGAILSPDAPVSGALVATAAIFLPGFLLMLAITPLWRQLSAWPPAAVVVPAINAAVTGLLLATLVASSSLLSGADTVFVIAGFIALRQKALNVIGLISLALGFALLA